MASNPMQRQKRVSFLLGMLVMLIIAAIIIALLFMQLINLKKAQDAAKAAERTVYVISTDVASGSGIQVSAIDGDTERTANVSQEVADNKVVPENFATASDFYTDESLSQARSDLVAKIDLKEGTILTKDMLTTSSEQVTNDLRKQEYNMLSLPTDLVSGDFVDVRIRFGNGQDYIIAAKKQVTIPTIAGAPAEGVININLSEDETIAMSSAIIETYQLKTAEMYVSRYTDPGMQVAAIPTYPVNAEALNLMDSNPNLLEEAKKAIASRYNRNLREQFINSQINSVDAEDRQSNLETSVEEHITQQKELRQKYLQSLEDAAAAEAEAAAASGTNTTSKAN
jgi:competence protein ComGC